MTQLWNKGKDINKDIHQFTVGNDFLLDQRLVPFDCQASIAHANMLHKIGVLSKDDLDKLVMGLQGIKDLHSKGEFTITKEDEDCHTAIENDLTKKFGDVGKKIHTGRSRNDQVISALRLYEKDALKKLRKQLLVYQEALRFVVKHSGEIPLVGYTHMRKAMPTTIGIWLDCFADAVDDNIVLLDATIKLIDQSPLGSAAGFGVPVFNLDRQMTATEMNFAKVMKNPLYCQMSRGKFESNILNLLTQIMFDLNKLASDLILFSMKGLEFVTIPKAFCTGSSIMPQKYNPDVLELVRAKYHVVLGEEMKVKSLISNLISGYNRDIQLTKDPLFISFDITADCLNMLTLILEDLKINENRCEKAITPELFATEQAYKLVKEGVPFREAYKQVGEKYK